VKHRSYYDPHSTGEKAEVEDLPKITRSWDVNLMFFSSQVWAVNHYLHDYAFLENPPQILSEKCGGEV